MKNKIPTANHCEHYRMTTHRDRFLAKMNQVVPWKHLCAFVKPYIPDTTIDCCLSDTDRMLRIYFLQHWFNLSDWYILEALHESHAMSAFAGIDFSCNAGPSEQEITNFRYFLERHNLREDLMRTVEAALQQYGLFLSSGIIIDASISSLPRSSQNTEDYREFNR